MLKLMGEIRGRWAENHTSATSGITTIVWKIISASHNGLLSSPLVKTKLSSKVPLEKFIMIQTLIRI